MIATHTATGRTYEPTGTWAGLPTHTQQVTSLINDLTDRGIGIRDESRLLVQDAEQFAFEMLHQTLEAATAQASRRSTAILAESLAAFGFAWKDVARVAGVSVPALRKWRLGERAAPANHLRLATFVATCEVIRERCVDIADVASWLEVPLDVTAPITGLDVLADGFGDLLLEYASDMAITPQSVLDRYEPDWRTKYASQFEVYVAEDGHNALRTRADT